MSTRLIDSDMWEDDFFTSLNIFERLLWIGLITTCADDQGRLQDNPALIRSKVFPVDDIPLTEINSALYKIVQSGKIARYTVGGKKLIQIVTWWKHQTPRWAGKSNYPAPVGWVDRERYHISEKQIATLNWESKGGFIDGYLGGYKEDCTPPDVNDDVKDDDDVNNGGGGVGAFAKIYESEIGSLTSMISDELAELSQEYSLEWFTEAVKVAVDNNARKLKYVTAVLDRWKVAGFKAPMIIDKKHPVSTTTRQKETVSEMLDRQLQEIENGK